MKEIKVTDCTCPFVQDLDFDHWCEHPDLSSLDGDYELLNYPEPPYWCPLKKEPIKISLIDK